MLHQTHSPTHSCSVADFVRAAQGFCVVGILTYALSLMILVAYITVPTLQETRGVLIALCLLIFSAGELYDVDVNRLFRCSSQDLFIEAGRFVNITREHRENMQPT